MRKKSWNVEKKKNDKRIRFESINCKKKKIIPKNLLVKTILCIFHLQNLILFKNWNIQISYSTSFWCSFLPLLKAEKVLSWSKFLWKIKFSSIWKYMKLHIHFNSSGLLRIHTSHCYTFTITPNIAFTILGN